MVRVITSAVCVLALTAACGEGGAGGTDTGLADTANGPIFFGNPSALPDAALVSATDSTPTVNAIARGLNPETSLISSRFFCYDEEQPSIDQPDTLTINGNSGVGTDGVNTFEFTLVPGPEIGQVAFVDSESEQFVLNIEFTDYGQVLSAAESSATLEGCYQEGAAHENALNRFNLNTPEPGVYSCATVDANNAISIELLANNAYRVGAQSGSYETTPVINGDFSEITFTTGVLQGVESDYFEDPQTGRQVMQFQNSNTEVFVTGAATSSSSTAAECERQSTPKPFKLYGSASAPSAIAPEVPLSGAYFIDTSFLTGTTRGDGANYIDFRSSGYTYVGLPLPGGTNCSLTRPNGLPLCEQYQFDGTRLSIVQPWGTVLPVPISTSANGTLQTLDDFALEPLAAVDTSSVIGTWVSQEVDSFGIASCAVGVCSSSITDRVFHFRSDGHFLFTFAEESSSTFTTGVINSFANSVNNDEGTGTYRIVGNRLVLTIPSGQATELPVHLTQRGRLAVGEIQYSRP